MEGKRRAEGLWSRFLKQKYLWVLVVPGLVWITIFCYVPLYGVTLAFKDYVPRLGITGSPWVGLKYFRELFSDSYFWNALRNTLMYGFLNLLVGFPVPIIFAVLLNELFNMDGFKKVVQTISYLPHFLSWAFIATFLISITGDSGLLNVLLTELGLLKAPYAFMSNSWSFIIIIVMAGVWKSFGYNSIMYLAAMATVDQEMFEASHIDGANRFQRIWYITLPSIKSTTVVLLILSISSMMQSGFEQFYLLRNNLVMDVARVLDIYTYSLGFEKARLSYATAVGLFKSVVSVALLVTANTVSNKVTGESIY